MALTLICEWRETLFYRLPSLWANKFAPTTRRVLMVVYTQHKLAPICRGEFIRPNRFAEMSA